MPFRFRFNRTMSHLRRYRHIMAVMVKYGLYDVAEGIGIRLRRLTAQVEFSAYTGLSVPKEAVYQENDENVVKTYIFLLPGLQAEKVYVDILSESGDSYIVKNGTENGTALREGSTIIVQGKDLFDGKVVGR